MMLRAWWRRSGRDAVFVVGGWALLVAVVACDDVWGRALLAGAYVTLGLLWG